MPANGNTIGGENTTIAEHIRLRRPTNQTAPLSFYMDHPTSPPPPPPSPPPSSHIPSLIQSTLCKSSISSLFLSTFSNTTTTTINETSTTTTTTTKKKNFTTSTFRGMGCAAASPQVSVPAVARTSVDWEAERVKETKQLRKKKNKKKSKNTHEQQQQQQHQNEHRNEGVMALMANNPPPLPPLPSLSSCLSSSSSDVVWCGPGVGFGGGADDAARVDCVVTRRYGASRGKIDGGDKINHRERSFPARRVANPEHISVPDFDSVFGSAHSESDVFGSRYSRHVRHRSPEALAEILMLQSGLLMGGRLASRDQFRDWRLNIDGMTYEDLLALGDRIGYVSTGLKEQEMSHYLKKIKGNLSSNFSRGNESKCSICQEEYEANDEMGKLNCGHSYHMDCIKQWLLQKNACPVCKSEVVARR